MAATPPETAALAPGASGEAAASDLDENRAGQVLSEKWVLLRRIGAGGMGSVYEAQHRNGRRAAVKVLHRMHAASPRVRARFLREGYAANRVGHPGAVAVLDDDVTADGTAYLVMELLEGQSLAEALRERPSGLPAAEVADVAMALLETLEAAHRHGIVHRDIKPDNVFRTMWGDIKLLDFGIARVLDDDASLTRSGAFLGTPAFVAPELASGKLDAVDERTDLWAVGATMFTLLSGRTVHTARNTNEALVLAATMPAPPVRSICPAIPEELAAVIDRALSFSPSDRCPSAKHMREAIASALGMSLVPRSSTKITLPEPPALQRKGPSGQSALLPTVALTDGHTPSRNPSVEATQAHARAIPRVALAVGIVLLVVAGLSALRTPTSPASTLVAPPAPSDEAAQPPADFTPAAVVSAVPPTPSGSVSAPPSAPVPKRRPPTPRKPETDLLDIRK